MFIFISNISGSLFMHGCLPAEPQRAMFPTDSSVSEKTIGDSSDTSFENKWFSRLCDWLWPEKPANALDQYTSAKLPQCYRYASARQQPPATLMVELLRGPEGGRFLDAVMRGAEPEWWIEHQSARKAAGIVAKMRAALS